jgi:hypothetical protein
MDTVRGSVVVFMSKSTLYYYPAAGAGIISGPFDALVLAASACIYFGFAGQAQILNSAYDNLYEDPSASIVSWNAGESLDAASLQTLLVENRADIAVISQSSSKEAVQKENLETAIKEAGINPDDYQHFFAADSSNSYSVSVLIKNDFGQYHVSDTGQNLLSAASVLMLEPDETGLPAVIAAAPAAPHWGSMQQWREQLGQLADAAREKEAILAGDLQATAQTGSLAALDTHADALRKLSKFERGTWPANLPSVMRADYTHVLVPVSLYNFEETALLQLAGSNHLAVVTRIVPTLHNDAFRNVLREIRE